MPPPSETRDRVTAAQQEAPQRRQALVEAVRALKSEPEESRPKKVGPCLKAFQREVDWLTERAVFAETALVELLHSGAPYSSAPDLASADMHDESSVMPSTSTAVITLAQLSAEVAAANGRAAEAKEMAEAAERKAMKVATAAEKQMAELRDAASDEVAIAVEKYEAAAETIRQLQAELVRSADAAEANDAAVQSAREELRASQAEAGVALARTREHAETLAGERAALLQKQGEWGSEREAMQRELEGLDATVKAADERTREANVARAAAEAEAMAAKAELAAADARAERAIERALAAEKEAGAAVRTGEEASRAHTLAQAKVDAAVAELARYRDMSAAALSLKDEELEATKKKLEAAEEAAATASLTVEQLKEAAEAAEAKAERVQQNEAAATQKVKEARAAAQAAEGRAATLEAELAEKTAEVATAVAHAQAESGVGVGASDSFSDYHHEHRTPRQDVSSFAATPRTGERASLLPIRTPSAIAGGNSRVSGFRLSARQLLLLMYLLVIHGLLIYSQGRGLCDQATRGRVVTLASLRQAKLAGQTPGRVGVASGRGTSYSRQPVETVQRDPDREQII